MTIVKTVVGLVTMSMSVLASALDSFTDVCQMCINLVAVRTAEQPADTSHPFGHGKAEAIAGFFQAILIAGSAAFLISQSFHRIIDGYRLEDEMVGISVMVVAMIASVYLTRRMKRVGEEMESSVLLAGALNFGADVWTNAGVLIALTLERAAHVKNADPIISILISVYIVISSLRVGRDSIAQLMDKTLPADALAVIDSCIRTRGGPVQGYHRLRTRRVGAEKHIEFHLEIDCSATFETAHDVTEAIIADIQHAIPRSHVIVHSDPV